MAKGLLEAKKLFIDSFAIKDGFNGYIVGVGIRSPDTIRVLLERPLPDNLKLPEIFEGFNVETEVVGPIQAQ